MKIILALITILCVNIFPQTYSLSGRISDKETGVALAYANVRVLNSSLGTTSNPEGEYDIKLEPGEYKLIASYIGYKTDTISVDLKSDVRNQNFRLLLNLFRQEC